MLSNSYPFHRPDHRLVAEFTELTVPVFGHRYDNNMDTAATLRHLSAEAKESLLGRPWKPSADSRSLWRRWRADDDVLEGQRRRRLCKRSIWRSNAG
jgi:hypothetical protein